MLLEQEDERGRTDGIAQRAWRSFRPGAYPLLTRRNFSNEIVAIMFFSFLLAGIETGIVTVLAKKGFDGVVPDMHLDAIVALLGASKAIANLTSFIWVRLNHGRDKIVFTASLQATCAIVVVLLAMSPRTPAGLYLFAGGVLLARMVWAGFITIRSTIWNANYERSVRAVVTGKLATVQVVFVGVLGIGMGLAMDLDPDALRIMLPVGAVMGLIGITWWRRIRVRGHGALLRSERHDDGDGGPSFNPLRMLAILRADRPFAGYMACMFVLGTGNLMVPPLLAIVVVDRFDMTYLGAMLVTNTIPFLVMPLAVPLWSHMLSRMHVIRFRVFHAQVFALANGLFFVSAMLRLEPLLYVAAAIQGLAFGGGALAWTLGHLDFAPPNRASQYMSVHVTLTGVRGLIAPFLGVLLDGLLAELLGTPRGLVFGLALVLSALGGLGFYALERTMRDRMAMRHQDMETTPVSRAGL